MTFYEGGCARWAKDGLVHRVKDYDGPRDFSLVKFVCGPLEQAHIGRGKRRRPSALAWPVEENVNCLACIAEES